MLFDRARTTRSIYGRIKRSYRRKKCGLKVTMMHNHRDGYFDE
jgi:hypothetical protein